ncbi:MULTISPECIES: M16 family metallopeptidase [Nitrospirillum]|uniref:Zinc protease n=1 Tax=Nitrospirillum amazonense TaxID=28077 RepID=A0A560FRH5_9PROT|nr:pitrilysin family protein [Nitrospirillum amazonense]MEC4591513.1 pitrilysin family protein [Nitrospirillum amazonense]TWB24236.1 zinc protease [Nitrospirillum amazonense]
MGVFWRPFWGVRFAALALALMAPAAAPARVFDPETFTLANGLQVVVVPNHRAPVVTQMLFYKAGAADEPSGKSGVAHYLEHLMFRGTATVPSGAFSREVAAHGGVENAYTNQDQTVYFQTIARDQLPLTLRLEADRMANLRIRPATAAPELAVVLNERRQRTEASPAARLREQVQAALFQAYPYARPVVGRPEEVAALTPADARAYYMAWYAPNNAVLVVAGDISAATLRHLAEATFGRIPARPVPNRVMARGAAVASGEDRRIELKDAQVRQPSLSRVWVAPSHGWAAEPAQVYALEVLQTILGGGATGRLYQALVVRQGLAAGVSVDYLADALGPGQFSLGVVPGPEVAVADAEAGLNAELARLLHDGVSAAEVAAAIRRLQVGAIYARDSLQGPASEFGVALTTGQSVADVEAWPDRVAAITVEDVNRTLRTVLGGRGSVTALLLPDPDAPTPEEELEDVAAAQGMAQGAVR